MEHGAITLERPVEAGTERRFLHGYIAEFERAEDVLDAARRTYDAGYRKVDAYSPFPVDGLPEALGFHDHWVPLIMLIGGLIGCIGGFSFLYYCTVVSYPLNIGGRPLFSWPYWIPITFEFTVLFSALSGVVGMFMLNRLPMPYHPVFDAPNFNEASSSRFFLCIEATDPRFESDPAHAWRFMESLGAVRVSEVEARK
jgi:hypothetical protein